MTFSSAKNFLLFSTLILIIISLYFILIPKTIIINWTIISLQTTKITFPLILDKWGIIFSCTVRFISANVLWFSEFYISQEPNKKRFCNLVIIFILSMNFLIFIPRIICLLLGWDGLGIVSFILVIYYQNSKAIAGGIITALINRVGDAILLLSIGLILKIGHWSILALWDRKINLIMSLLIIVAAITKSAQIPFSSWLPAAIAAPTPVSALVHSSTLVTAGVFIIFRFHYALHKFSLFSFILIITASLTILIAGIAAIAECDIKKIIALSTLSQLGVIIATLRAGIPELAFFHLITHAIFKALLFLTAGTLIFHQRHRQDLRSIGDLIFCSPTAITAILIANISLCGAPFLSGFYSKDFILEITLFSSTNVIATIFIFLATILTISYSARIIIILIWNSTNRTPWIRIHNKDNQVQLPLLLLTIGAIVIGTRLNWLIFNYQPLPILPSLTKNIPLLVSMARIIFTYFIIISKIPMREKMPKFHLFNSQIWFLQPLSSQNVITIPLFTAHFFTKTIDQGWIEQRGGQGIKNILRNASNSLTKINTRNTASQLIIFPLFLLFMYIYFYSLNKTQVWKTWIGFSPKNISPSILIQ